MDFNSLTDKIIALLKNNGINPCGFDYTGEDKQETYWFWEYVENNRRFRCGMKIVEDEDFL